MTLANCDVVAFVATTQWEKARAFYREVLGLCFEGKSPSALIFKTANATLRIKKVQSFTPLPFTTLAWTVEDVRETAQQLIMRGVQFERSEVLDQDDLGIWVSHAGAKVCWFKDPNGNLLLLTQLS